MFPVSLPSEEMATRLPSSCLEGPSTSSNELELPLFDDYAMLTMLLRLIVILKNKDGDASIHGFTETADVAPDCAFQVNEAEFATLDAVSAILVQEHEVVAAAHLRPTEDSACEDGTTVSIVNLDDDSDAGDEFGFPIDLYANYPRSPLHFAIAANPRGSSSMTDSLHNLRCQKIDPTDGHWKEVQKDDLCRIAM